MCIRDSSTLDFSAFSAPPAGGPGSGGGGTANNQNEGNDDKKDDGGGGNNTVVLAVVLVLVIAAVSAGIVYMVMKRRSNAKELGQQLGSLPSAPAQVVQVVVCDGHAEQAPASSNPPNMRKSQLLPMRCTQRGNPLWFLEASRCPSTITFQVSMTISIEPPPGSWLRHT
eukprot:TRINITY_DN16556_c0_g1_i2.p1 TRINITY_DN16556_c0_g1~~TRINITY_DN16556_c0_g1_i2.p1  ORF type:complete len:169 (+),score=41.04 TRINITY_DN16556_c0_g1_i2:141-647(+)